MERVSPTPSPRHVPRAVAGTGGYRYRSNTWLIGWWHRIKMTVRELVIPFPRNKRSKSVTTAGRPAGRSYWLFSHIIEVDSLRASRSVRNNGEVTKLTWPLVTDIKNPRYTSCRYLRSYDLWNTEGLKPIGCLVWSLRSLKVRHPFFFCFFYYKGDMTFGDLGWNFYTRCLIQFSAGTEKMAALRAAVFPTSAKNRREGIFCPPLQCAC